MNGGASTNGRTTRDPDNTIGISLEVHTTYRKTLDSISKEGYYVEEAQKSPPKRRVPLKMRVLRKQVTSRMVDHFHQKFPPK